MTITDLEPPARYVRLSKGAVVKHGGLAGTDTVHAMVPDEWTGSACAACFGWADDPRHLITPKARL